MTPIQRKFLVYLYGFGRIRTFNHLIKSQEHYRFATNPCPHWESLIPVVALWRTFPYLLRAVGKYCLKLRE